jgi:glycine/D-amino acid oxidase-like deaminating enzyme
MSLDERERSPGESRQAGGQLLAIPPRPSAVEELPLRPDVLVVGAGTMGAWTAYWAQAGGGGANGEVGGGRTVLLVDAWGAGHPRATSGDETRIIRSSHGADRLYPRWARRALEVWRRFEAEWGVSLFVSCGALWFGHREDGFEFASGLALEELRIPVEMLDPGEVAARWPQIGGVEELALCLHEPEAGALFARRGCQAVVGGFQRAGGTYGQVAVRPGRTGGGRLLEVVDDAGRAWSAGTFVFACGPWLPRLFPEVLGELIRVTKQDVVFVGPPAGDRRFHAESLPAWVDYDAAYWGIPAADERGFKVAPDRLGAVFEPTDGERVVDPESIRLARRYLRRRFPALADAPVVETRVCQYESTPDAHFVIDRHPELENVWLVGGGSGHGFKHGPRIGEYLVARIDGAPEGAQDGPDEARFRIGRREPAEAARTGGGAHANVAWSDW